MANAKSRCPHVTTVRGTSLEDLKTVKRRNSLGCCSCGFSGPNLWLCLHSGCLYVGCGESKTDHSSVHAQETRHPLTLNITTQRIWCYKCECEVFVDSNHPPFILKTTPSVTVELQREPFLKSQPYGDSDLELEERTEQPCGLAGLCNIGNTCYMNSALQALSNCPPMTRFFIDCPGFIPPDKKLACSYMSLMNEMWHRRRPNYVVPNAVASAVRQVHPMFRGFLQHDSQEFLRCMMDYLHEELKLPVCANPELQSRDSDSDEEGSSLSSLHMPVEPMRFSDNDYETCDSGLSSEHSSVAFGGVGSGDGANSIQPTDHLPDLDSGPTDQDSMQQNFGPANDNGNDDDEKMVVVKSVMDSVGVESQNQQGNDLPSNINIPETCSGKEQSTVRSVCELSEPEAAECNRNFVRTSFNDFCDKSGKTRSSPLHVKSRSECKKPKTIYCSIISDVFDGEILSSVQCMTCHRISCTNETFQDLSLPIPNKDHLALIHASSSVTSGSSVPHLLPKASCADLQQKPIGWFMWMYGLLRQIPGWIWGPAIRLQDCLAAFFRLTT